MQFKTYSLLLSFLLWAHSGVCQNLIQSPTSDRVLLYGESKKNITEEMNSQRGGGDSGGGTSVKIGQNLRLKDFEACPAFLKKSDTLTLKVYKISDKISKIDSGSITEALSQTSQISDSLFKYMVLAAAKRANWYLIDASLKLSEEDDFKLAIFKKPLGILIDENLFNKLSALDQNGLLFHESLRMISMGFGINLNTTEIESITCKAFSNQGIALENYASLKKYFNNFMTTESRDLSENYKRMWEMTFKHLSLTNEIQMPSSDISKRFFYQADNSKFETFRASNTKLSYQQLNSAFFEWAGLEVKTQCTDKSDCNYFEIWPKTNSLHTELSKWTLLENNNDYIKWFSEDLNAKFIISKFEIDSEKLMDFCNNSSKNDEFFILAPLGLIKSIAKSNKELSYIFNRHDLNTMQNQELAFLSLENSLIKAWAPNFKSESGLSILHNNWVGSGRAVCVSKH